MKDPGMMESWWLAHRLDLLIAAIAVGALAVGWVVWSIVVTVRERQQRRRDGL